MEALTINDQIETVGGDIGGVGSIVQVIWDLLNGRISVYAES